MFDDLFSRFRRTPAAQALLRRVEAGGALTCGGVAGASHAFVAAWLHHEFPDRPIVLVAEHLKAQETLHQDLGTWLGDSGQRSAVSGQQGAAANPVPHSPFPIPHSLLFFPAWETLPHEDKLPHADVISERLETLVALMANGELRMENQRTGARRKDSAFVIHNSPLLTTSITALLQRTFAPALLATRTRTLRRGERVDPLDLIEWLEDMGYDSEAQVSAKGDIALRGGIVDVFPLTSPWPVRLEFFGDELESLRTFDPVTQVSREGGGLEEIVLPPAGELGVLKREVTGKVISNQCLVGEAREGGAAAPPHSHPSLATLLDYLPDETIVILCEPEAIEAHAEAYAEQIPDGSPFFATWEELRGELLRRKLSVVALMEEELEETGGERLEDRGERREDSRSAAGSAPTPLAPLSTSLYPLASLPASLTLTSLDAFRPITQQMPTQEVALALRQEFFLQLLRWLRQGFNVQVLCNNDGEAQRFSELWQEIGMGSDFKGMEPRVGDMQRPSSETNWHIQFSKVCHHTSKVCHHEPKVPPHESKTGPHTLKEPPHGLKEDPHESKTPPHGLKVAPHEPKVLPHTSQTPPHGHELASHTLKPASHEPQASAHEQNSPAYAAKARAAGEQVSKMRSRKLDEGKPAQGRGSDLGAVLPHPSPLPLGEGANASALGAAPGTIGSRAVNRSPALSNVPPLPAGEGRGEGEMQRSASASLATTPDPRPYPPSPSPSVSLGSLARGFLCEAAKFVVVTDAEIFGRYKVQRPRRMKSAHAVAARSAMDIDFSELEEGDYVVHLQHGIGRFKGLKVLPSAAKKNATHLDPERLLSPHPSPLPQGEGTAPHALDSPHTPGSGPPLGASLPLPGGEGRGEGEKPPQLRSAPIPPRVEEGVECLVLEYAPSDTDREPPKLYVPITEAHLVSKYVGAGKLRPPLNTLGGKRWEKTKQQAERAVRDVAADLLKIQAQRATQPGHAFGPDTPWQREFESSFLYEETADQLRAIAEAKHDLEVAKPMDRLVCGDVGFGKTEVAIRAAFKCVMGGKQVAILVPTTVLAQQHYNTFRERMADYPVRVELLSRYRTKKEQLHVVEQLQAGAVDIVVGTHRLVQSDVTFKDLGLVVIDEEQRFGVMHKEKFKLMRTHVDVLTLSATPIPRTLYLALTGARDMSTIATPPQDRLPVETLVEHYDDRIIRDAIRREVERGGQVFFLHNRVTTIEVMRSKLQLLVPNARIVVGHGQMSGDELEDVMTKFVNGEADVLLSTTIIESGLDIPNANTIIIDRADRFGLSQLYQLRGRVGRYKHQAFAYLLLPRHARLLTDVRKRMSAIKQYAQLGSGFKIAMRDLEIRGAGNLLGAQQSGHITAVGFELYCTLLKQSVATLKGEKVKQRTNAGLRLDFLKLHAVEEGGEGNRKLGMGNRVEEQGRESRSQVSISVPRDSDVWVQPSRARAEESAIDNRQSAIPQAGAFLPPAYVPEPQHRIEAYRKLAQAETKADVEALGKELRDRYGKWPKPVELLLVATELRLLAGERGLDAIETKGDKLMLHRRGDFIQLGGKFPRLMKTEPLAVLKEIKKLLLSL
ncbi:MAG: Transcription-repair-coupling factor [Verrucomicrobiota bacterium]|jgi:transcription-repair coupling factor (superfamily II helicase)